MTLILALKWVVREKEGVVISSDSKVTLGPISYETKKVYPIVLKANEEYVPLAVAGGAGEASLVKQAYRICEKILTEMAVREWGGRAPTFDQFEEAIRRIEKALFERFEELRSHGIEPSFNMILASVDENGKASIYLFDDRGLAEPIHDNPGFAVIGTGFFTGGILLLRLLGYAPENGYALDMGVLSAFIIDIISEVDLAVGPFLGESYYMRVEEGRVILGPLTSEAIKEFKDKVRQRKEIMRRLWRILDLLGEGKVLEKIEDLEKDVENGVGEE